MSYNGTREAFAQALLELAERDDRYVCVLADTKNGLRLNAFAERFPRKVFDTGVAEQCSVDVAAGLASDGLVPFVATYAGFLVMRACEQVRTFVAYPRLNVKLVGCNGGLLGGEREGPTHQYYEDVAIARSIPNLTVVAPCDQHQTYQATHALARMDGPCYLRLGNGREPVVTEPGDPFELGKARVVRRYGDDLALFVSGYVMSRALAAAEELHNRGVGATVVDVHTVKPLDTEMVVALLDRTGAAVVYEDHSVIGGLFGAIAEANARHSRARIVPVGVRDVFGESGVPDDLLRKYHLDVPDVVRAAEIAVGGK